MNCDKLTQPRLALRRSLFWKISRLVFFATAFGLVLHFFGAVFFQQIFTDKVMQITSWEVAEHCKRELQPFLEPAVDQTGLARAVNRLEELNPLMEIFVLDRSGNVLYNGRRDRAVRIPVEPIAQFLAQQGFPARPIYGANGGGYDIDGPVPFSAAQISVAGEPGYLYTSLRSQRYRTTYHALGDFALPLAGLIFLAALLLLTTGLGSILAYWFTRRFRALTAAAGRLAAGDYRTRVSDAVDDEIGLHARVFNQMAETIEQSIATISESEELRRQLVANVSHDLRTPIAATMALLETIDTRFSELNEEELQQFIQRARLNCLWLKVLVDELFELSELDAQKEKLVLASVPLETFVRTLISQNAAAAEKKDVVLAVELPPPPSFVLADQRLLHRALGNLLENGIRYSREHGEVKIVVRKTDEDRLKFSVSDRGIGIPADELPHIFDRFYRGKLAVESERSGSGLGLAIAKRIIELHDSTISVTSLPGKGTEFSFELRSAA